MCNLKFDICSLRVKCYIKHHEANITRGHQISRRGAGVFCGALDARLGAIVSVTGGGC